MISLDLMKSSKVRKAGDQSIYRETKNIYFVRKDEKAWVNEQKTHPDPLYKVA